MDTVKFQPSIGFVAAWFAASIISLIFSLTFSFYLANPKTTNIKTENFKLYAALPKSVDFISDEVKYTDARAKIIEDFFKGYKSPLSDYSQNFIQVADKYQLDWRLLPAIAMQESNGGKKVIVDSHNPFGYGIYGKLVIRFKDWDEAIERVGKALREDYLNEGLKTPHQIMAKYTPPSLEKGGAWANGVSTFMSELQ